MFPILLALFSAMCGGIANLLARRIARLEVEARDLIGFNFGLMALMLAPAAPLLWRLSLDAQTAAWLLLAIGLDGLANYGYFRSFKVLDATTASSLMAVSPLFALLLAPAFGSLAGGIHAAQIGAVILLTGGTVVIVGGFARAARVGGAHLRREGAYPLGAAFLFAASLYPLRILFSEGATNPYTYYLIRAALIGAVAWALLKPKMIWLNRSSGGLVAGRLVFVIAQWLALLSALQWGHPAVVKAVADLTPLFVLLIAWGMSAEKPSRAQAAGVVMIALGVALLTGFSPV